MTMVSAAMSSSVLTARSLPRDHPRRRGYPVGGGGCGARRRRFDGTIGDNSVLDSRACHELGSGELATVTRFPARQSRREAGGLC